MPSSTTDPEIKPLAVPRRLREVTTPPDDDAEPVSSLKPFGGEPVVSSFIEGPNPISDYVAERKEQQTPAFDLAPVAEIEPPPTAIATAPLVPQEPPRSESLSPAPSSISTAEINPRLINSPAVNQLLGTKPATEPEGSPELSPDHIAYLVKKARNMENLERRWNEEELEQLALKSRALTADQYQKVLEQEEENLKREAENTRQKLDIVAEQSNVTATQLDAAVRRSEILRQEAENLELEKQKRNQRVQTRPAIEPVGFWLAGAGPEDVRECSETERRKICAIGYTVLVPTIFALIAASYAVGTLTPNPVVITLVAIAWAAIILIVDRAIIATYSPFMKLGSKISVIVLRICVAVLMGLTVSHPLTLLLFKDTIHAQIEAERDQEIQALRDTFATQKKDVEARMVTVVAELDKLNKRRDESYEAKFIRPSDALNAPPVSSALSAEEQLSLTQRTDEATKSLHDELDALTLQIQTTETKKAALQAEVDDWQRQFEAEINGQRSGVAGIGPRARSIQKDQLEWRRTDLDRLADELRKLAGRRVELNSSIASATERIRKEVERSATERAAQVEAEQKRIADMQRITQEEQMKSFLGQQEVVRAQIQASINSAQADKDRLSEELKSVVAEEASRLAQLREAPRKDMLSQTLALHHLFENPEAGGSFALMAYLVLAGLFLAIDTMPILVKFTSKKGEFEIRREQALKEAEEGAIFGNLPSDLRELTEPEREQLHKQVVAYYEREQERKLLLKEKEVAEARTKKAASEKHNELELAKRDKEIAIEMARLAGREHRAKEARFAAAVSEIDRQIGDPKKLKLSVMKQKVADAESDLPDADFGAAQA